MEPVMIYETEVLGAAFSAVPPDYHGACRMEYGRDGATHNAVFPTVSEANSAAHFAVGHLGGFDIATLFPAPGTAPTHRTWMDWAL